MATEYVDAGQAFTYSTLSTSVGKAPDVAKGLTSDRLLNARDEPQNWLTYYGAYDGQRYSSLDQINKENVGRLVPQWVFQAGSMGLHSGKSTYGFEVSPIIVDGVMYISGWDGQCWAVDAAQGNELWRYKHASPFDVSLCCGNVNRGVAVAQGLVFMTTLNAHIIALDAETGRKVWDQPYGDVRAGESATVAPLVVKDMVIVGSSGGEFGSRGHTDAFKLETGNPCPDFDGGVRPGDNLYTDSGVAVDAGTGEIKAHFQYTPHDLWDYDSTMEHILFDLDGQKLAAHFDKNGFLYILDRTNMEAVRVAPFVDRIDWGEVDEKGNVKPLVFPDKEGDPVHFWPGPAGAKEWTHACYSPNTELLYCPVQDIGATATRRRREFVESIPYWGAGVAVDADDISGSISAFDPRTGAEKWRWRRDMPMCSSLLTTAGGLVFGGEPTGEFNALDAETGDHLWMFQCGSGHHSSPSTYSVDGKQYIVAASGWGGWAEGFLPMMLGSSHGDALFAFALPDF